MSISIEKMTFSRGVRLPDFSGSGVAGNFRAGSNGIGRGPDTFVLLEIPTVSESRDSIRARRIAAMSGQFDFRSARQNSDAIGRYRYQ